MDHPKNHSLFGLGLPWFLLHFLGCTQLPLENRLTPGDLKGPATR